MMNRANNNSWAVGRRLVLGAAFGLAVVGACGENRGTPTAPDSPVGAGGAGGTAGAGGGVVQGACSIEGEVRDCYLTIGEHDGIVNCFQGQQECLDGQWTECAGDVRFVSLPRPVPPDEGGGLAGLSPRALTGGGPTSDVSGCTQDPCNPYCMGQDEDPDDVTPAFVLETGWFWGEAGDGIPKGMAEKQNCDTKWGGCADNPTDSKDGFPRKCNGNPDHYNKFDTCQSDTHCDLATDLCVRNDVGWTWEDIGIVCNGVDLTIGFACTLGGRNTFPLCNRGNVAVPAGTVVDFGFQNGNQYDWTSCEPDFMSGTEEQCSITLTDDLGPGECVQMVEELASPPNPNEYYCEHKWKGNETAYVNLYGDIAECGMHTGSATATLLALTLPGCVNNWGNIKTGEADCELLGGAYVEHEIETSYTAICPDGTWPVWESLYWDSIIGCSPGVCDATNRSSITFAVQTGDSAVNPIVFTPEPPEVAASVLSTNPAICLPTTTPSASCPAKLNGANVSNMVQQDTLQLTITLSPSPDALAAPTLNSWQITYSCVPSE